ncbi:MBOAT family O-acyltransferase [Leminorella grimontii]|uniref:MBOAT family O-acyltransferase n=1 Tax=Leminorella grimontii TaxID=82981 RepID=UPI0003FDE2A5|nr:MBOAT family O-acyltransferase [Leminorella grimontii]KFC94876.1 putative poly(beta-D-mannuronate) O-acetylase [Leminorella grimontii ATCC 33999 = DSM 5078]VFS61023.1 D-alanyl-lipoteichoic acid biosynthesis protein DltB [Leminorella grimontii]
MNFFSLGFAYCFLLFFLLYWSFRPSVSIQNGLLLGASYLFIGSFSLGSAAVLLIYSLLIYGLARFAHRTESKKTGYILLALLVCAFFVVFKYYPFFRESLQLRLSQLGLRGSLPTLDILVPLGLSFYAFHSVSYVVSVAKKEIEPARFPDLLLYLSFFPSVVAGPINRAIVFLPQIRPPHLRELRFTNRAIGLIALAIAKLFLCSAFLAENYVNGVFDAPDGYTPLQMLAAVYAYAWQIYFNFSGYTNLVTGLALLLGFYVPKNFDAPYVSLNLQEFWKRWHISLSTFIRDYIYIPLGGNRHGFIRKNANLMVAMVLSGIWHGAGVNFIIWGALHGLGLVLFNCRNRLFPSAPSGVAVSFLARLLTFHYVCFAWIFFRANDLDTAMAIVRGISSLSLSSLTSGAGAGAVWSFLLFFIAYPLLVRFKTKFSAAVNALPWYAYPVPLVVFLTLIFIFTPAGIPGFIYANF